MSLRDQILAAQDIKEEILNVPEWGVSVLIRGLSARQRARLLQDAIDARGRPDLEKIYPELAILTVHDPDTREPVFKPADRENLAEKSGAALERIAQAAMRLSGLRPEDLEMAEKN